MSHQFVVQLPNRPGELSHLAKALCARGVNIVQIQQTTAGDITSAQIFTDCCDDDTRDVLRGMGYPFVAHTNLTVEIEDTPCAFSEINDRLVASGVGLRGCCVIGRAGGVATWAFAVDDENRAREILGLPALEREAETARN
jgi:hypothetical protein